MINLIAPITSANLKDCEMPESSLKFKSFGQVIRRKIERLTAKSVLLLSLHYNSEPMAISQLKNAQTPEVNCWPSLEQKMCVRCCHISCDIPKFANKNAVHYN